MQVGFPCYLLVTSGYLVVTSGYLNITSGYLIAISGYFWLRLVTSHYFWFLVLVTWLTSIQGLPYMKTMILGLKLIYSFINFIITLPMTYVRHF